MKNNKFLLTILIIFILILIFLTYIVYNLFLNKLVFENHSLKFYNKSNSQAFKIDKIVFFSSCNSDSTVNSNTTTTINNLLQYTDIAIFINNLDENFTLENTLKSVSINVVPRLGTPNLYYKSLNDFATSKIDENNILDTELDFKISTENEIDYNTPVLFNNCANPITLSYINSNIKNNYTIPSNNISYDGSLLKKCNIVLNDLYCNLSFTIYIENNLDEKFKCPIYLTIPLDGESSSIYDGSYTYTYNPNYTFYKYK